MKPNFWTLTTVFLLALTLATQMLCRTANRRAMQALDAAKKWQAMALAYEREMTDPNGVVAQIRRQRDQAVEVLERYVKLCKSKGLDPEAKK